MEIRDATPDDWPDIWPFFSEIVAEQETYAYDPELTSEQARALWLDGSLPRAVVALVDGRVVGSAIMGANRPGPGSHVASASFMVAPTGRGHGVGRGLGEHVINWARGEGFDGIQFNAVVETNTAAVRLWQSLGFQIVGTVPRAHRSPRHGLVGIHVMYLPLAASEGQRP